MGKKKQKAANGGPEVEEQWSSPPLSEVRHPPGRLPAVGAAGWHLGCCARFSCRV